jgi:hypothetical protein
VKAALVAIIVCVVVPARAAEPANRLEATFQYGRVLEQTAIGPQVVYARRVASWRRLDAFVGTTQVYRLTPAFDDPEEFGVDSERTEYRHHWSALFGPGALVRLPPADRLVVGADVLAGFALLAVHGRFQNPAQGIDRSYSASDVSGLFGTRLWMSFRFGPRWSVAASYWQPLHLAPSSGWHVGLGASLVF